MWSFSSFLMARIDKNLRSGSAGPEDVGYASGLALQIPTRMGAATTVVATGTAFAS